MRKLIYLTPVLLLVTLALLIGRSRSTATTPTASPLETGFRFRWPAGETYRYELDWKADQVTRMDFGGDAQDMRGVLAIEADLVLRSHGDVDGITWLGLSFVDVDRATFTVAEQEALTPAALTGKEALVAMRADGRVAELRFDPADDSAFPHLVQALVAELEVIAPPAAQAAWQSSQDGPRGRAVVGYRLTDRSPVTVDRRALRYEQLTSLPSGAMAATDVNLVASGSARLDDGALAELRVREKLAVGDAMSSDVTVTARLVARTRTPAGEPLASVLARPWESRAPGTARASADTRRRLLEKRAAGMTVDDVISDLFQYARGGMMPDHQRWLWRATAALMLDPDRAAELVMVFEDTALDATARGLVLDLLASAGHPQAQAAIRAALDTPAARADADAQVMFVQRLGLVVKPTAETLTYLSGRARSDGESGRAHLMALGAAVGSAGDGDGDAGFAQLTRAVEDAATPADEAVALRALGNTGSPRVLDHASRHARSTDREVRRAAAIALRKVRSPGALETLLQLLSDPDLDVQRAALAALAPRDLDASTLGRILALARAGTLGRGHDTQLLDLAAHPGADAAAGRGLAQVVLDRNGDDPRIRARARAILGRLEG